jgi:hypothetical protein
MDPQDSTIAIGTFLILAYLGLSLIFYLAGGELDCF